MSERKVGITGLGVICPNGIGIQEFWQNICEGVSGIEPYTWGEKFGFQSPVIGAVRNFEAEAFGVSVEQETIGGRHLAFALAACRMALADAQLDLTQVDSNRIGVSIASAIAGAAEMEKNLLAVMDETSSSSTRERLVEHGFRTLDFSMAATTIAQLLGISGTVTNLTTGCTAGLDAVGFGLDAIRHGIADIMIVGATEAPLCPSSIGSFEALGALSTRLRAEPYRASCPFTAERDGFVIAEGCGIVVLESLDHARRRGARVYAELRGYASVNNGYHMTDLPPNGMALAECISVALSDAHYRPDMIDHVSAHGSSTPQNDINETNALKHVFADRAYHIPVNSLKSMTGHALSAANAIEIVALSLEIHHQKLHPTINYRVADPQCDLDYIPNFSRETPVNAALKLSSGFSGIHSVAVLTKSMI